MSHAKSNSVSKAVRLALLCGAATGLGMVHTAQAADQDQNANNAQQSTAQLGKIEVTGTKIKRTDVEQAQPVTIVTAAQIKAAGLPTIGAILQKLTSSGASLSTMDNFGGNFTFTGGGQSTVDLRYLDAKRTLVLVNGKRWVTALDGTVDLNTIPSSIIDHVEVLQDGASAIYGSDAVSGVVNIITVKDYNGREANAYAGIYNGDGHWDGRTQTYDFTLGSSNDKSGLVFNISYENQDGISSGNRNISKEPVVGQGTSSGSSATPQGRFVFIPNSTIPGTNPNPAPGSNPPAPGTGLNSTQCPDTNFGSAAAPNYQPECNMTIGLAPNGQSLNGQVKGNYNHFVAADRFNYAPYNYVLTPEERFSTYLQGYTDLADNVTFRADMMYSHRDSRQQAAPEPLFFASSSINIDIPANQPYNPFGADLSTSAGAPTPAVGTTPAVYPLGLLGRRMIENGPRTYHEKEDTYRFSGGLDGFFNAAGSEWDWDVNYAFSKDSELDINGGHFDLSKLKLALGDPAICASTAAAGCVPLNLFGGQGSITPAMLAYVGYTAQNSFENNQRIYSADITNGTLFEEWAGAVGFAAGVQSLEHDGEFLPDSVAQAGNDTFNPGRPVAPVNGRTYEKSLYTEFDIPLLRDLSAAKLLDLDVAGRHTKYSTYGSNNTYRAGLKWEVSNDLLVRGTWSQAFRAPNINELFSGATNLSAQLADPCSGYNPATEPVCAAQGVPLSYTQPNAQINTLESGNPNLKPETAISRTAGVVYSPDALPGFNINADYYKIDVEQAIEPIGGAAIFAGCYTSTVAASNPTLCGFIHRSPTFGTITTLNDTVTNIGSILTEGVDIGVSYAFPSTGIGDFKASLDDTHVRTYQVDGQELAGIERGGSVFPFGVPRDKIHAALDWTNGSWSAEYTLRFIRHMDEPASGGDDGGTLYHDVWGSYKVDSLNTTFTVGVRNLFAKEPPVSQVQQLNSFDPTLYDVPGRFIYGRISVKF